MVRSRTQRGGTPVPEPLIGSFLLESITTGMYGERKNAIREYVQNAFDGIQAAVETRLLRRGGGRITITMADGSKNLVVLDDGVGLPHRVAVNRLTAVGASRKKRGQQAGFRGIGRLAGIAFCKTLTFRTKAAGEDLETLVSFNCEALREGMLRSGGRSVGELISSCTTFDQYTAADSDAHFFEVSLIDLVNAPVEATDPHQMALFLSQVAPVDYHPDFRDFKAQIFEKASELELDQEDEELDDAVDVEDDDDGDEQDVERADWSVLEDAADDMLERIPVPHVAVVIRSGRTYREERVYKPFRPTASVGDSDDVPIKSVTVHSAASGAWWGWIAHKDKPGTYDLDTVGGLRFRLKNIQIDGSELITLVPSLNKVREPFRSWSNWFMGEIHIDPRAVVPNARRDNFEEDARWDAIRDELTPVCAALTAEARKVSENYQSSMEEIQRRASKLKKEYLSITQAKVFNMTKAKKLLDDSDKLQKLIEKAGVGAPPQEQLGLKTTAKELAQIRLGILEMPKSPEFEHFRAALLREFTDKTIALLNDYLDIDVVEEIAEELEEALKS